jgi:hypothetical protein
LRWGKDTQYAQQHEFFELVNFNPKNSSTTPQLGCLGVLPFFAADLPCRQAGFAELRRLRLCEFV